MPARLYCFWFWWTCFANVCFRSSKSPISCLSPFLHTCLIDGSQFPASHAFLSLFSSFLIPSQLLNSCRAGNSSFLQIKRYFIYEWWACVCECMLHMAGSHRDRRQCQVPLAGVTAGCEPLHVGAGSWIQVLWKEQDMLLNFEPSLKPSFEFFIQWVDATMLSITRFGARIQLSH